MQAHLRRIHGASANGEGDDPQWHREELGERVGPLHHVHRLGRAGVAAREAGQLSTAGLPVSPRRNRDRHGRGVQQPIGGGSDHDLTELSVGRGSQDQQVGIELGDHFDQTAGHRSVGVAVVAHIQPMRHRVQIATGFLG